MQQGVAIAGNILVDYLKCIQTYPRCGMLALDYQFGTISGRVRA
jgi:hypothetical protein